MSSTTSSTVPGLKSQFTYNVPAASAPGSLERVAERRCAAQSVWRTGGKHPAHAVDTLGHAVAVAEGADDASEIL